MEIGSWAGPKYSTQFSLFFFSSLQTLLACHVHCFLRTAKKKRISHASSIQCMRLSTYITYVCVSMCWTRRRKARFPELMFLHSRPFTRPSKSKSRRTSVVHPSIHPYPNITTSSTPNRYI